LLWYSSVLVAELRDFTLIIALFLKTRC